MTLWAKEKIVWVMAIITVILYMDVWAWDRIYPILFGAFPYHVWYTSLLFVLLVAFYGWWSSYQWEDFTDTIVEYGKKYQEESKQGGVN